jgi:hypothetical protein
MPDNEQQGPKLVTPYTGKYDVYKQKVVVLSKTVSII